MIHFAFSDTEIPRDGQNLIDFWAERFRDHAIAALALVPGDTSFLESLARYALGRKG